MISYLFMVYVVTLLKVKVTLEQARKAQKRSSGVALLFYNLGTRCGGRSTPRPGRFTLGKRPGTHFIGGWVGHRACQDRCGKSPPHRDSIPGPSSP
jgi:hypothetical protein